MSPDLAEALARLKASLDGLETSVGRHFDLDIRKSDLETELQVMQDDRSRLATELESATAWLGRASAAHDHVGGRLDHAIATIRDVLGEPDAAGPGA